MSFPGSTLGQTALNNLNSTFNSGTVGNPTNNNSSDLIQTQQAF